MQRALLRLTAVLLGVLLLHEHIPLGPWHLLAYTLCLLSVVAGAIRLADPEAGPIDPSPRDWQLAVNAQMQPDRALIARSRVS